MKTLLFVIDSLSSGGAEKSLISLLRLIDYRRYEVDLLLFSPKGLYLPLLPKEVNVLEAPSFIDNQRKGAKQLLAERNVKDLLLRWGNSVSIRSPWHKRRFHGAQIAWRWYTQGIPAMRKEYDVAIAYSQGTPTYFVAEKVSATRKLSWLNTDYEKAKYNKSFDQKYYEAFHRVVAVSEAGKTIFTKHFPDIARKTEVVYDIVSPKLIRDMAKEGEGYADGHRGIKILTIGRLVAQKGYDMAMEACLKLKRDGIDVRWYVIGEGELERELKQEAKALGLERDFVFLGTRHNPYPYLKACDIYVQPSRFEGYGLAIAEARILNIPVVATDFPTVYDQLRDGENGIVVNMNADDVYLGIKRLIENETLRRRIKVQLQNEQVGTEAELSKIYGLLESSGS